MARDIGDKLAPKLVRMIADTIIATRKGMASHEVKVRQAATQGIIDQAGSEVGELYRELFADAMASENVPQAMRSHMEKVLSGEHQCQALLGPTGLGSVAVPAIGTAIGAMLTPFTQETMRAFPYQIPPVNDLAAMVARGVITYDFASSQAKSQGFDFPWFQRLVQLALQMPDAASAYAMVNRGLLPEAELDTILQLSGMPATIAEALKGLRIKLLAPADAALAVLRGNITHEQGVEIARANGISAADFEVLIGNTGEPPGVMDLLSAFRRGFIDQAELTHGILESRVRNEWIPTILKMRYQPMTTADAIDATVQNHLTETEARRIAQQNGLEPSAFDPLRLTAGSPLAKDEMLRLYKRGKVTKAEVEQALRESRLKDKYIPHALELATQIPAYFAIEAMLKANAITDAEATALLRDDGYQDNIIASIIKTAHKAKTVKVRTVTEGMLSELYQEEAITAQQFIDHLKVMGYSQAEASEIRE